MPTELDGTPGGHGPALPKPTSPSPSSPWWARLDDVKVTPRIALLFFLGLVVLSGLAAGVGFAAHQFRASVIRVR